jgi:hypothetical protein
MYFVRRILFAVPLLLLISALAFALVHVAPGGPFDRERKPASPEIERNLRAKYHLDEPVWKQYGRYLGDLVHADFGVSLKYRNHSVADIIAQGLPVSMLLGGLAFCCGAGGGFAARILHRRRARTLAGLRRQLTGRNGGLHAQLRARAGTDSGFCNEIEVVAGRPMGNPLAYGSAAHCAGHLFCRPGGAHPA